MLFSYTMQGGTGNFSLYLFRTIFKVSCPTSQSDSFPELGHSGWAPSSAASSHPPPPWRYPPPSSSPPSPRTSSSGPPSPLPSRTTATATGTATARPATRRSTTPSTTRWGALFLHVSNVVLHLGESWALDRERYIGWFYLFAPELRKGFWFSSC